jgi:hypothetical protein
MKNTLSANADTAVILNQVRHLLDGGQLEKALQMVADSGKDSSAIMKNVKAVCLLRLGRHEPALTILRDLVFPGGSFSIPDDTPTIFRANYVTALFLLNNPVAGIPLLQQIPETQHPQVQQLKAAVRRWKRSLPWWRRMLLPIGIHPTSPLRLDGAPGELWIPESVGSPRPVERVV